MNPIRITGIGSFLPRAVSNDELPPLTEPITEQQLLRIGVHNRHWAESDQDVTELAAHAAQRALKRAGLSADELDLLILSNWTERRYLPDLATRVQYLLTAPRAFAFDVSCACAGFLVGLHIAQLHLDGHRYSNALVVSAETTSRRAAPGSRATLVYSDGAGAVVLQADPGGGRVLDHHLTSLAEHHAIMDIDGNGYTRVLVPQRELIALAASSLAGAALTVMRRNRLGIEDIDWMVPHSGTCGVQAALRSAMDLPADRILTNLAQVGNLSSAAIPVALDHFVSTGVIRPGQMILSASVGIGFYAAATLFRLP